jgi:hypothetical protein
MVFNNNLLLGAAGQSGAFDTTLIERSAWFDGATDYMARQNGAAFANNQEAIFSFWVLRTKLDTQQVFFGSVEGGEGFELQFENTNKLWLYQNNTYNQKTTAVYRDIGWYHILVSFDTSQATASDRVKLWVNGEQVTNFSTATYNPQNTKILGLTGLMTGAETMRIGNYNNTVANYYYFSGYVAQACMLESISIQQGDYAVSDFLDTYTFGVNGSQYVPKADADIAALATAAGGNSFCLTTAIGDGTDASGNGNNFTPTSMSDAANGSANTPSLVYPVLNILDRGDTGLATFKDGNEFTVSNAAAGFMRATMSADTGKFYYECQIDGLPSANFEFGMQDTVALNTGDASVGNGFVLHIASSGAINLYEGGTAGASQETGVTDAAHTFQCAVDFDSGKFWFGRDDTWYGSGNPAAGTNETGTFTAGLRLAPVVGRDSSASTVAEQRLVWDSGSFGGTMPTGFLEWSSANLPTPVYQGIDYFNPILYTGNGSTNAITGVGFQPDLVWIKNTSSATSHSLYDAVRGVQKQLESDNTSAETTETTGLTAFGSDGFTVGSLAQVNGNTNKLMGWSWLAGGAGASNTDGSITSTVSKAAADHFSIVTYTGTGAAATVGHGLGGVPDLIMVKNRGTTGNWATQSSETSYSTNVFYLDLANNFATAGVNVWNNTDPTSSVFSINSSADTNASTNTYVAYCFKNVPGVCQIGSYKGNGSSDGPYISLGFTPSWLMVKSIQGTYGTEWFMYDLTRRNSLQTYAGGNANYDILYANLSSAGTRYYSTAGVDFIADGFKIRGTATDLNHSGTTFLYIAIADIAGGGDLPPIYGR